jgi:hypothetical protein
MEFKYRGTFLALDATSVPLSMGRRLWRCSSRATLLPTTNFDLDPTAFEALLGDTFVFHVALYV